MGLLQRAYVGIFEDPVNPIKLDSVRKADLRSGTFNQMDFIPLLSSLKSRKGLPYAISAVEQIESRMCQRTEEGIPMS